MTQTPEFGRRLIVTVDAKGYGSSDEPSQREIQEAIPALLDRSADHSGLHRQDWDISSTGDGEIAVLPMTTEEPRLLDDYVREVSYGLRRHNHNRTETGRLRLRMAIHHGSAVSSPSGYYGNGIVTASRVLDSDALRGVLSDSGADLVVAVTAPVYQDVVAQGHARLRPEDFRLVSVRNKEFDEPVWVHVPGTGSGTTGTRTPGTFAGDPGQDPTGQPDGEKAAARDTAPEPAQRATPAVRNEFHGSVDAPNGVFGVRYY
ncbi:hypothetical protein [Nocardiopsis lucentensis]|uniref:hypothetical protein n=1 Tax=Nocardiopsis lucentensis TaxID=53441 RepID=UPI0003496E17|nr:hypothetical protein [Nocardiopsis lucentensis]